MVGSDVSCECSSHSRVLNTCIMKRLPPFLFCILFVQHLSAQGFCAGDTVVFTETAHPVDYTDAVYKTAAQIDEWNFTIPENIPLRVYYPTDLPAGEKRPLIALVHGGFFIWGSYLDFDALAKGFAERGFIAATIEYRLCHRGDCEIARLTTNPCNVSWGSSFLPSAYVSAVDVNDGIRWLQAHADEYHIDPEKVVVAGHSAGAFTALNAAFLDQAEIQQLIPAAGVSGKYLGEALDPVTGIRACISMSGASFNTDWIEASEVNGENIAVGLVHGTSDGVVDYGTAVAVPCCQTYNAVVYGSCTVAKRVKELGGNYYLLSGEGFGHDIGESPWVETVLVQLPAFVIKTVLCGENIEKHSAVVRSTPLAMCPGNNPNLQAALPCDVDAVTPAVLTPVREVKRVKEPGDLPLTVYQDMRTGLLHVQAQSPDAAGNWMLTVIAMDGRALRRFPFEIQDAATIDPGDLPTGVYGLYFQAAKGGQSGMVKVYKQ